MQKITVELDHKSLAAVDQELARIRAQMPGENLTRSDAVRSLILEGIAKGEAQCAAPCPDHPEWICSRRRGHTGRHESADGGDRQELSEW
jgi:hypothetical protein